MSAAGFEKRVAILEGSFSRLQGELGTVRRELSAVRAVLAERDRQLALLEEELTSVRTDVAASSAPRRDWNGAAALSEPSFADAKIQFMPDRTIAIGDIHGCSRALEAILKAVEPASGDTIITLGDYVDRGSDSRGVVDQLLSLNERCRLIPLTGNHELMLLQALVDRAEMNFWLHCGGQATLASYGGKASRIPLAHLEFFEGCHRYHEGPQYFFVHANYLYDLPLAEQPDMALFWEHISYRVPLPHMSGKKAVVGHTPQINGEILDAGHVVCIDTFCFGTGCLTALDVESGQTWQADKFGSLRQ